MGEEITIFRGSTGLNNKIDPVRIRFDAETGVQDLATAYNVDIDSTGRISRRKGYPLALALASGGHSLFGCGNYGLFASASSLYVLNPNFSSSAIATITPGARVRYVMNNNEVFYMNGHEKGRVIDKTHYSWVASDYVGPPIMKEFSDPPIGHLLELYNGRMYVAQDNILWHSEPLAYSWFNLARNFIPFADRLRMVRAVKDGLYVSTGEETLFLGGAVPREFQFLKVADYPAIEGTDVMADGSLIGNGEMNERVVMWTSSEGICMGGPGGLFKNLTQRRLVLPSANEGAGLFIKERYVATMNP